MTSLRNGRGLFLSTPSGWRATAALINLVADICISIHALRVEGDFRSPPYIFNYTIISIHALRVEGDIDNMFNTYKTNTFLSTPSGWRATSSISPAHFRGRDFYPRPPGGGRRSGAERRGRRIIFLSTPSGWRATREGKNGDGTEEISIHALRVEGDLTLLITGRGVEYFYPRPPGGGRRCLPHRHPLLQKFLSTPSGWRATRGLYFILRRLPISIHALRVEGDLEFPAENIGE